MLSNQYNCTATNFWINYFLTSGWYMHFCWNKFRENKIGCILRWPRILNSSKFATKFLAFKNSVKRRGNVVGGGAKVRLEDPKGPSKDFRVSLSSLRFPVNIIVSTYICWPNRILSYQFCSDVCLGYVLLSKRWCWSWKTTKFQSPSSWWLPRQPLLQREGRQVGTIELPRKLREE